VSPVRTRRRERVHRPPQPKRAFDEVELLPQILNDVSAIDTSTTILGTATSLPLALASVGASGLMSARAEVPAARAAAHAGVPFALSTRGSVTIEALAEATDAALWFQLYVWGDRGKTRDLVARAKSAGHRALLVTADVSVRSKRERELRSGLHSLIPPCRRDRAGRRAPPVVELAVPRVGPTGVPEARLLCGPGTHARPEPPR
jgi:hypothetical protein